MGSREVLDSTYYMVLQLGNPVIQKNLQDVIDNGFYYLSNWINIETKSVANSQGRTFPVNFFFYTRINYKNFNFIGLPDSYSTYQECVEKNDHF